MNVGWQFFCKKIYILSWIVDFITRYSVNKNLQMTKALTSWKLKYLSLSLRQFKKQARSHFNTPTCSTVSCKCHISHPRLHRWQSNVSEEAPWVFSLAESVFCSVPSFPETRVNFTKDTPRDLVKIWRNLPFLLLTISPKMLRPSRKRASILHGYFLRE